MSLCFADARQDPSVGVIVLTGAGDLAFCSGGDQSVRGQVCGGMLGKHMCVCTWLNDAHYRQNMITQHRTTQHHTTHREGM